ncbi:MAG: hypothetical protein R6U91_08935 [Bacillota bacterium]
MFSGSTGKHNHKQDLVIFDFAGTLSLDTVLFSRNEVISRALEESGLAELGVTDPGTFWSEVVGPTWEKGSTTDTGYVNILSRQIKTKFSNPEKPLSYSQVQEAAAKFTENYFAHSQIDPKWKSTFDYLSGINKARVIIATDHYAEATKHIANELKKLGFAANPVSRAPKNQKINIANSADLGFNKSTSEFWSTLHKALGTMPYNNILLIDDFGFNEQEEDVYGGKNKALSRRDKTTAILKEIFQTGHYTFPFFLERSGTDSEALKQNYHRLIEQAHAFIKKHI